MPTSTQNIVFSASIVGTSQVINGINQINLAMNGLTTNIGRMGGATSAASGILQTAFGYVGGRAIVGGLESIARSISGVAISARESISDFQRLGGVINVVSAREMQETAVIKERIKVGTTAGILNKQQLAQWKALTEVWRPTSLSNMQIDLAQARAKLLKDSSQRGGAGSVSQDLQNITTLQGRLNEAQATYNRLLEAQGPTAVMKEITRGGGMGMDQALLASQGIAASYLKRTQDFITHAPVKLDSVAKMFQTLAGYGVGKGNALGPVETSFQLAQGMSNFGIALGKDNEALLSMAIAMGQVQSKGKLMAEEMNRQFNNAGITMLDVVKAFEMAYPTFGLTTENFAAMMKGGKIEGKMFVEAMRQYLGQWDSAGQRMKSTWAYIPQMLQNIKDVMIKVGFEPVFEQLARPLNAFIEMFDTTKNPQALDGIKAIGDSVGQFIKPAMDYIAGPAMSKFNDFLKGWQFGGNVASGIANMFGMGIRIGANQWNFKSLAEEAWKNLSKELDRVFNGDMIPTAEGGGRSGGLLSYGQKLGSSLITNIMDGMISVFSGKGGENAQFGATSGLIIGSIMGILLGIGPLFMGPLGAGLGLIFKDSLSANLMPTVADLTIKFEQFKTDLDTANRARVQDYINAGKSVGTDVQDGIKSSLTDEQANKNIWIAFFGSLFGALGSVIKGGGIDLPRSIGLDVGDWLRSKFGKEPLTKEKRGNILGVLENAPLSLESIFNLPKTSPGAPLDMPANTPKIPTGGWLESLKIPPNPGMIWDAASNGWRWESPEAYEKYISGQDQPPMKQVSPNMPGYSPVRSERYTGPKQPPRPNDVPLGMIWDISNGWHWPAGMAQEGMLSRYQYQTPPPMPIQVQSPYKTGSGWGTRNPTVMGGMSTGTPSAVAAVTGGSEEGVTALAAPIAQMNAQVENIIMGLGYQGPQAAAMFGDSVTKAATSTNAQMTTAQSIISQMATIGYPQLAQVSAAWQAAQMSGLTNLAGILQFLFQLMMSMNLTGGGMGIPGYPGMTMPGGGGGGGVADPNARHGHFRTSSGRYENPFTSGFDLSYLTPEQVLTSTANYNQQRADEGLPPVSAENPTGEYIQSTAESSKQTVWGIDSLIRATYLQTDQLLSALAGDGGGGGGGGKKKDKGGSEYRTWAPNQGEPGGGVIGLARGIDFTTPSGTSNDRYPFMAMLSGNERVKIMPNHRASTGAVVVNKSVNINAVNINNGLDQAVFNVMLNRALST